MKYDKIWGNPKQMLSLTGFRPLEFEAFSPIFKYNWEEYHSRFTLKGKIPMRVSYGGKSSRVPCITDRLLFILSYAKNDPPEDYRAAMFDGTERPIGTSARFRQAKSCYIINNLYLTPSICNSKFGLRRFAIV
jgi:hypothetical protein